MRWRQTYDKVWKKTDGEELRMFLAWCGYALLCISSLGVGTAASFFETNPVIWGLLKNRLPLIPKAEPFEGRNELFVLVLGCDEDRAYGGKQILETRARTDTIQLVRFDFEKEAVGIMQIPRDIVLTLPGYGHGRINALHVKGGPQATAGGVEYLTGIRPDRVIVLDYDAIEKMVDEIGGVEVFVDKRMRYRDRRGDLDINLQPGMQLLNGKDAIGYVRYRQDSDFHRGERQQEFMVAFKQKVTSEGASPTKVTRLANLAMQVVGGGITVDEFVYLGDFARGIPPAKIRTGRYPVDEGRNYDLIPDRGKLKEALVESGLRDAPPTASRR